MEITYYGHSCFKINCKETGLLFDPFITPNELAKDINIDNIKTDFILISHGHEDHLADAERIAKQNNAKIISNFEIVSWFGKKGIEGHPMNHGGKWKFNFGTVKFVNAIHSSTLPDGSNGGNPGGFIVYVDDKTFYFAGDTALTYDMKIWGEQEKFDFLMLPIGDNFTMGVDDAIEAAKYLNCNKVIAMHYDTFPYIVIDKKYAKEQFQKAGIELIMINIGESLEI